MQYHVILWCLTQSIGDQSMCCETFMAISKWNSSPVSVKWTITHEHVKTFKSTCYFTFCQLHVCKLTVLCNFTADMEGAAVELHVHQQANLAHIHSENWKEMSQSANISVDLTKERRLCPRTWLSGFVTTSEMWWENVLLCVKSKYRVFLCKTWF